MTRNLLERNFLAPFFDLELLAPLVELESDEFCPGLSTYLDEAEFFYGFLEERRAIKPELNVLEIGSGVGALSLMLSSAASRVVSLEPSSPGFERVTEYRSRIIEAWKGPGVLPDFRSDGLSSLREQDGLFDLVVCVNVLEHVPSYRDVLSQAYALLRPGGRALFVFPNYAFPYEPHFEIPIVFSKGFTRFCFRGYIARSPRVSNPLEHWEDLSWPTQQKVKAHLDSIGVAATFGSDLLEAYSQRLNDSRFLSRKSWPFRAFRPLVRTLAPKLHRVPVSISPVVECWLEKREISR